MELSPTEALRLHLKFHAALQSWSITPPRESFGDGVVASGRLRRSNVIGAELQAITCGSIVMDTATLAKTCQRVSLSSDHRRFKGYF